MMHRHELDRGHAQRREMADRGLGGEAEIGAAQRLRNVAVELGVTLRMQLVDQRLVPRNPQRPVVAPGERRVHDRGDRRVGRAVTIVEGRIVAAGAEPEQRIVPADRTPDDLGVGIQYQLVGIESMTEMRRERPVNPVAVELSRMHVGHVAVPDHVGLFGQRDRQRFHLRVDRIEQAQLDPRRVLGEDREVDPDTVPGRAEGMGRAWPYTEVASRHSRRWYHVAAQDGKRDRGQRLELAALVCMPVPSA